MLAFRENVTYLSNSWGAEETHEMLQYEQYYRFVMDIFNYQNVHVEIIGSKLMNLFLIRVMVK